MSTVTIIQLAPHEVQAMLDQAVETAIRRASSSSGEHMTVAQLAAHYHCTERTIRNRELAGDLPRRNGRTWRRADVLAWDADRTKPA